MLNVISILLSVAIICVLVSTTNKQYPFILAFSLILGTLSIVSGFKIGSRNWEINLRAWKECKKIDLENGEINALVPWNIPNSQKNYLGWGILVGVIGGSSFLIVKLFSSNKEFSLLGVALPLFSIIPFYVLGNFLKRISWLWIYQKKNNMIFYNELGKKYSIIEFFNVKKRRS